MLHNGVAIDPSFVVPINCPPDIETRFWAVRAYNQSIKTFQNKSIVSDKKHKGWDIVMTITGVVPP
jgi:hypothetical protein